MKTLPLSAVAALLALALCAPSAEATTAKCQRTIAKANSQFVQARMKALQKCEEGVVKGSVIGPCPDAKAMASITKAGDKLAASIDKSCGGVDKLCGGNPTDEDLPIDLGWPAKCPNFELGECENQILNCGDIATCLECMGARGTDQAANLYYDELLPAGGDKALLKCQTTIGKATTAFLNSKSKVLQKCWDARLNGKHSNSCVPPAVGDGKYLAAIQKAEDKKVAAICKACGGANKACGGGDDFTPAQIGFPSSCPAVTLPADPFTACGGITITDVQSIVDCVDCVTEFKADCLDQASVPQFVPSYPSECNACVEPAPTGACPTSLTFTADGPNVDLDTGFTGLAQDAKVPTNGRLTLTVSGCAGGSFPCGQCSVSGPLDNVGGPVFNNHRCQDQPWVQCSIDQDCIDAGATGPCIFFFGSPLPLVAGGVSTCVINELSGSVSGTINLDDGTSTTTVPLNSKVHPTGTPERPCPVCDAGLCSDGPRTGQACLAQGTGIHGDVSLDCPPNPGANAGTLSINLLISTGTQTRTVSMANPACRQTGYTGLRCLCDTCNNGNADACSTNVDCPISGGNPGICGGRRCLGGPNFGSPCTNNTECPGVGGSPCGRPGEATQPNVCLDDTTSGPNEATCVDIGDNEGECAFAPNDKVCTLETFRSCTTSADCNPPPFPGSTCPNCVSGQACNSIRRPCFTDNGTIGQSVTVQGEPGPICGDISRPIVGTFFCVAPVSASAVNAAGGLPALGRVRIPGRVEIIP